MLRKTREKFAKRYLLQQAHALVRKQKAVNLESATTLAILYFLPDEDTYNKMEAIIEQLSVNNLNISVLCYSDSKIKPHYFLPKLKQDIILAKQTNWRFQPQPVFYKEFIKNEFDILLDLTLTDKLPLLYCAALSKAHLKIGRFEEEHQTFYDLMIHTSPEETLETFVNQIIHYISKINN